MMNTFFDMVERFMEVFMDDFSVFGSIFYQYLHHLLKGNGAQRKVAWRARSVKDAIMGFKNFIALTP